MRKYRNQAGISNIYAVNQKLAYAQLSRSGLRKQCPRNHRRHWQQRVDNRSGDDTVYKRISWLSPRLPTRWLFQVKWTTLVCGNRQRPCWIISLGTSKRPRQTSTKPWQWLVTKRRRITPVASACWISTDENQLDSKYTSYLATEFKWLFSKHTDGQDYYSNVMNRGLSEIGAQIPCRWQTWSFHRPALHDERNRRHLFRRKRKSAFAIVQLEQKEDYQMNGDYFQTEYFNRLRQYEGGRHAWLFHYLLVFPDDGWNVWYRQRLTKCRFL